MKIFIASSWKNKDKVFEVASLLEDGGHIVYNFADFSKRKAAPLEDEVIHNLDFNFGSFSASDYERFICKPQFTEIINENKRAIRDCDLMILLIPAGLDAHIDWAYAVGLGKPSLICGVPQTGARCLNHNFATGIVEDIQDIIPWINKFNTPARRCAALADLPTHFSIGETLEIKVSEFSMLKGENDGQ
jgi:hypothetical protein